MDLGFGDVKKLAELLKPPQESDSSDDDLPQSHLAKLGPGNIGFPKGATINKSKGKEIEGEEENKKDIWHVKEVPEGEVCDDSTDPRKKPKYDMVYRQNVSPEDIYLQMGGRTPATASCEDMVVRVHMPGERYSDMSVDVTRQRLDIRSPQYRLGLELPHPVDPGRSQGQWDSDSHTLTMTLRMQREFDYVNF